jgi:hypothetical protein
MSLIKIFNQAGLFIFQTNKNTARGLLDGQRPKLLRGEQEKT